ncbi:MFS family permease [Azospirillum agricola]|uniref:MFS transporter n=1 Tax=Azospirillum agricola TaxID=1720247 RepID=UPI001AE40CB4|nr:MFS transporter [Azospirillum agricola]MBP2231088.1 MFS family permease [Azospirillum agricola]
MTNTTAVRMDAPETHSVARRILTVFLPFALAYFLSYLYRTVNAVIADELTAALGVTAAGLGFLTSAYFIAFGLFQPPLGLLLDRYGPRRVESALLVVAAAGAALFALGGDLATLAVGRALIGLGVSACLMAALTANVMWWPRERLPLVNGLFLACGGLGAVFATTPVRLLLDLTDWRGLFLGIAAATVAVAVALFVTVPERRPEGSGHATLGDMLRGTAAVFRSPVFWRLAPACATVQGGFLAYISLWAGPWLRDVEAMDRLAVATHLQHAAVAMVAGYASFGLIADAARRFGLTPLTVQTVGVGLAVAVQGAMALGVGGLSPAVEWVLYSYFASASVMGYSLLTQRFPAELAGRVSTAVNLLMFVVAFTLQPAIGAFLGLFPAGAGYAPEGHRMAMLAVVALQAACMGWQVVGTLRHR